VSSTTHFLKVETIFTWGGKKHQLELLGAKNKITGSKNHMIDLAADLYTTEERISGIEDKSEELSRRQPGRDPLQRVLLEKRKCRKEVKIHGE